MVDFIDFWEKQAASWNTANFCNNCWFFGYPQTHHKLNSQQVPQDKACCVNLLVTDLRWSHTPRYNFQTGLRIASNQVTSMTVHFLKQGQIGENNYNETLDQAIETSKWKKTIKPLVDCLNHDAALEWCTILGHKTELISWNVRIRQNWLDQNYDGLSIEMSYRSTII